VSAEAAYADVMRITRREARNFAWGVMVLPRPKRQAIAALYAFARRVDDIADSRLEADERRSRLEVCRASIESLPTSPNGDSVLVALADAMSRYPIPKSALSDLIEGGLMDVEKARYANWQELHEYCRRVAGAVGLACTAVYGPRDHGVADPLAERLGLALQQINIMRDVREDWELGRVYLPQDELDRFGVSEDDIAAGRDGSEWRELMDYQAARADRLLRAGLDLLPLLDRRSALCVRTFAGIYRGLLVQMRTRGYNVFTERPQLSGVEKVRAVAAL
jgi:15-cis-phytoene synthase